MATDIGTDMDRSDFALRELDGSKDRPLRTAGAKVRRTRRNVADRGKYARAMREHVFDAARNFLRVDSGRTSRGKESGDAAQQDLRCVVAARRQATFAIDARISAGTAQDYVDLLLDVVRRALLHDEHGAFAGTEFPHLFRQQRISDVEDVNWNARGAVEIGEIKPLERAQQSIGQPAENNDADLFSLACDKLVEFLLANEFLRGRQALFDFQPFLREDHRRMREPAIFETRRAGQGAMRIIEAAFVVFSGKLPGDMTGAHPQIDHDGRVACLGELKTS